METSSWWSITALVRVHRWKTRAFPLFFESRKCSIPYFTQFWAENRFHFPGIALVTRISQNGRSLTRKAIAKVLIPSHFRRPPPHDHAEIVFLAGQTQPLLRLGRLALAVPHCRV